MLESWFACHRATSPRLHDYWLLDSYIPIEKVREMPRRSSRMKDKDSSVSSSGVVEEARRKAREQVKERKRQVAETLKKKRRSKTPTRKKKKKMSESEKFMSKAEVMVEEIALEPCRMGKDSFGWRMNEDVDMDGDTWTMSATALVENSVFDDTLWFLDMAETLNVKVEAEPTLFKGTKYYGWACETLLTVYVDNEKLLVHLHFDLINSEYGIERIEDDLTHMDEVDGPEEENKKDGWGMESGEEEEEEEVSSSSTTKASGDGGWASCPMSLLTSKYFVLLLILIFLVKNESGQVFLIEFIALTTSFLHYLGTFVKNNLMQVGNL